jgi:hypothetical protein
MYMRIGSINLSAGSLGTGLAIGAGATLLAPIVFPIAGGLLKAATKGVIKTSMLAYEGGKGLVDKTTAAIGGIVDEAKAEVESKEAYAVTKPKAKPAKPAQKAKPKAAKKTTAPKTEKTTTT